MTLINKRLAGVLALALTALPGCTTRMGDLTLVSTKNIDLTDARLDARKGRRYKGEDCRFVLFDMIPFGLPNLQTAIDKALQAGNGNVMVDEVTELKETWLVVGHTLCFVAEGTVLNTQGP